MELTAIKYKQTEVGLIPEDWEVKKLGEVLKIRHGRSQREVEDKNGIYPILGTGGLMGYANKFLYDKESVLIGRKGTIDKPRYMSTPFWTVDTLFYSEINTNTVAKVLFYNFQLIDWYSHNEASGVPSLNASKIESIKIPLPSTLNEQKAIAQVLSDTDALIKALKKKITKKKLIKKGVMQKLLTPNEDWEVKILGELAEFYKGRGLPKSEIIQEGKYKCLHYGELFTKYKEEIRTIFSKTNTSENVFFSKSNDVLMPTSDVTPNGLATASCIREDNIILGGDVMVIRFSNQIINGIFLSYYITQNRKQVMQLVSGSTVYHLYGSDMSNFVLSYPNIEEQNLIVQTLSDMDKEISHLEKKLSKYQLAKQGMMQKLLTGKIRLV